MYVAPTPFALLSGTTGQQTLILPKGVPADKRLVKVGDITRIESQKLVVGYSFDLKSNIIRAKLVTNPGAGTKHEFQAYRMAGFQEPKVALRQLEAVKDQVAADVRDEDADESV